jgi:hypothetical protein
MYSPEKVTLHYAHRRLKLAEYHTEHVGFQISHMTFLAFQISHLNILAFQISHAKILIFALTLGYIGCDKK